MVGGEEGREMATTINTSPRLAPPPTLSERSSTFPTISSLGQEWKPSWICLAARDTMVFQSSPQFGYIDRAPSTNKSLVPSVDRALFRHCPTTQATNYRNTRQSIVYSLHVLWSTIYPITDTSSSYFLENHQLVATKLLFSFVPREYEIGTNDHICDETVRKWLGTHDLVPRGHDTGVCENTRWQHATVK